jgi:hypothetical protein
LKKSGARANQLAGAVAFTAMAHGLDLDDFSAHIGQDHAASGPHHHVGKFDHANTLVWQWLGACHGADLVGLKGLN